MVEYHVLQIELDFFDLKRNEWCEHHTGKFALIRGTTIHDFYDTAENALEMGYGTWGAAPFLIKEVQLVDKPIFL